MGTKTPAGAKRIDALAWDPDILFIVGLDTRPDGTIDGPEHPRWDPRVTLPLDEDLVQSIMRHRRNLQSVTHVEVDGVAELEDGRQRVRAGREAKRRLAEAGTLDPDGKPARVVIYSGMAVRGLDPFAAAILGHELNAMRVDDDDMTRCEKVAHALRFGDGGGVSRSAVAKANRWTLRQIDNALTIVERASPAVRDALRERRITMALATELAVIGKAELQAERLAEATAGVADGKRVTRAATRRARQEATGELTRAQVIALAIEVAERAQGAPQVDDDDAAELVRLVLQLRPRKAS